MSDADDLERCFTDVCDQLGCAYDNEAALFAVDALKAENARMREALTELLRHVGWHAMDELVYEKGKIIGWKKTEQMDDIMEQARKALEGEG